MSDRQHRILIADDHALVRQGMRLLLADHVPRAAVVEVGGFDAALAALEGAPGFDTAIIDLDMPGMHGADSIRALRARWPGMRCIVLSASEARDDVLGAIGAGAHGYLTKSMDQTAMVHALTSVLAGTVYVPPSITELAGTSAAPAGPPPPLTPRQRQVLRLLVDGRSNKEIAFQLGVAEGTVKMHLASLFRVLRARNRAQAVAKAAAFRL